MPRLGGLAIYLTILLFTLILNSDFFGESIAESIRWANDILSNYHPASFLIGFAEDLGFLMSQRTVLQ